MNKILKPNVITSFCFVFNLLKVSGKHMGMRAICDNKENKFW